MKIETITITSLQQKKTAQGADFWIVESEDERYFVWSRTLALKLKEMGGKEVKVRIDDRNPQFPRIVGLATEADEEVERAGKEIVRRNRNALRLRLAVLKFLAPALRGKTPEEVWETLQQTYNWVLGRKPDTPEKEEEEVVDIDDIDANLEEDTK